MLKKTFRLSNVKGVRAAKTFSSPFLTVKFAQNEENQTRFAFVISKAVDKRAVVRNRLKRNLSKAIEENIQELRQGYDIIVITRAQILQIDKDAQRKILKEILTKANLLK